MDNFVAEIKRKKKSTCLNWKRVGTLQIQLRTSQDFSSKIFNSPEDAKRGQCRERGVPRCQEAQIT